MTVVKTVFEVGVDLRHMARGGLDQTGVRGHGMRREVDAKRLLLVAEHLELLHLTRLDRARWRHLGVPEEPQLAALVLLASGGAPAHG